MSFLQGLHGAVALALLTGLLFAEEAGVPLPFAPGELTLLVAGLLIASGGLNPYVFIPLAMVACIAGSLVGYSWARLVGDGGLRALATRLRQLRNLERVEGRILSSGWLGIALELAASSGVSPFEVRHLLGRLQTTGVVDVQDEGPDMRYDIRTDLRPALVQLLGAMHPTLTAAAAYGPGLGAPSENS